MFANPSLVTRIVVGKGVGFLVGLAGFVAMPYVFPEGDWMLRTGILLWYTTLGAIVGVFGVFDRHPLLDAPLPWWVRDPFIGAWMNFLLVFFAHDTMARFIDVMFGPDGVLDSPFWFALEGALVGLLIGYFAARFGGEGRATLEKLA